MRKAILWFLVFVGVLVVISINVEGGDAVKVIDSDGEVCGCMYDDGGFINCIDDSSIEYVVIEASHC